MSNRSARQRWPCVLSLWSDSSYKFSHRDLEPCDSTAGGHESISKCTSSCTNTVATADQAFRHQRGHGVGANGGPTGAVPARAHPSALPRSGMQATHVRRLDPNSVRMPTYLVRDIFTTMHVAFGIRHQTPRLQPHVTNAVPRSCALP